MKFDPVGETHARRARLQNVLWLCLTFGPEYDVYRYGHFSRPIRELQNNANVVLSVRVRGWANRIEYPTHVNIPAARIGYVAAEKDRPSCWRNEIGHGNVTSELSLY